jgi:cyanophycinase
MTTDNSAGPLVLIGGAEDKFFDKIILHRIARLAGGTGADIVVIPTASGVPREIGREYTRAFRDIGVHGVEVLDVRTRAEANDAAIVERVNEASGILFTGGNQLKLTQTLGGTLLLDAVRERHRTGSVVAGTSAGASALSTPMIYEGQSAEALLKGKVKLTQGLGFLRGVVVDTHFVKRGRIGRLLQSVTMNPELLGIGLGEDTGVIATPDGLLEGIGSGLIIIVDGQKVAYTNVAEIDIDGAIAVENMVLHVLVSGCGYDIAGRRFLPPDSLAAVYAREAEDAALAGAAHGPEENSDTAATRVDNEGATEDSREDAW